MRKFEKISYKQFKKDISCNIKEYNEYEIPKRQTKYSAGYDFSSLLDFNIAPGEIIKMPTGIKVSLNDDDYLMIVIRSSMGFKYNLRMCNQVGIIEIGRASCRERVGQ